MFDKTTFENSGNVNNVASLVLNVVHTNSKFESTRQPLWLFFGFVKVIRNGFETVS